MQRHNSHSPDTIGSIHPSLRTSSVTSPPLLRQLVLPATNDDAHHKAKYAHLDMMDAELAKELREATDQLLDLGPAPPTAFPSSPHLQQKRKNAQTAAIKVTTPKLQSFSATSKLEVIHSPTDVRPWQWPVPAAKSPVKDAQDSTSIGAAVRSDQPIRIKLGGSVADDVDDKLPLRGLSSRVGSVKAGTSDIHVYDDEEQTAEGLGISADGDYRAASPSKLRIRTPINDVYINQYGERVVGGKVVGRILGGRPRPASRNEEASRSTTDSTLSRAKTPLSDKGSSPTKQDSAHAPSSRDSNPASSPPAFFLESFPNAFSPIPIPIPVEASPASTPSKTPKKERRPSRGGPPSILKAPRAVAGALTLAHSDNVDDPPLLRSTSFTTASDFGSPASTSSILSHLSPRIKSASRTVSSSSKRSTDTIPEINTALKGLQLQNVDTGLLSPYEAASATSDASSGKGIKVGLLPSLSRKPTPTIELSQAKAETVVLHGNKRQARASGAVQQQEEGTEATESNQSSRYASPAVSPPAVVSELPSPENRFNRTHVGLGFKDGTEADDANEMGEGGFFDRADFPRHSSASAPSSPLMSPRRGVWGEDDTAHTHETAADEHGNNDDDDKASLESAPSSLISLPVSTLTSSSRTPSHGSLERRRSSSSAANFSPSRRRPSSSRRPSSTSDLFAREVFIRSWSSVGSQARGWVVFELLITTLQGTPIIAHKRFSSFVRLRATLKEECKDQAKWLPELPTRRTGLLSKYDARYLEKRRRALQRWLEIVMLDKVWGGSEGLREWVLASD